MADTKVVECVFDGLCRTSVSENNRLCVVGCEDGFEGLLEGRGVGVVSDECNRAVG